MTVTLPRPDRDEVLLPLEGQVVIELTAAAILAEGLLKAWTCTKSVVSMVVELPSVADALEAGVAVARVLQNGDGTGCAVKASDSNSERVTYYVRMYDHWKGESAEVLEHD